MNRSISVKKGLLKLTAFVMSILTAMVLTVEFGISAAAETTGTAVFPLPSGGKYQVSVLAKYSWGATHESYISRYILKNGGDGDPFCVMDIPVKKKTKVYAVADGKVYQNNNHTGGGYNLVIKHNDGSYSYYGHLYKRSSLKVGTKVKCGDLIGYSGNSGWITSNGKKVHPGAHLHFEWSGHDPYCEFREMGYDLSIMKNSGASAYPHMHEDPYIARVVNTDGSLAINPKMSAKNAVGAIPENEYCVVFPDKSSSKWYYVNYNDIEGYSYYKYLERVPEEELPYMFDDLITDTEMNIPSENDGKISWENLWKWITGKDFEEDQSDSGLSWLDEWRDKYISRSFKDNDKPQPQPEPQPEPEPEPQPEPEPEPLPQPGPQPEPELIYTAYVTGTDGALAINSRPSTDYYLAEIPEGAECTVYPERADGNWYYVSYRGTKGYSYGKYLTTTAPTTYKGTIKGTDGALAINRTPSSKTYIAEIPEGATCTVYDNIRSGNWVWVEYNGIYGYSYGKYIK